MNNMSVCDGNRACAANGDELGCGKYYWVDISSVKLNILFREVLRLLYSCISLNKFGYSGYFMNLENKLILTARGLYEVNGVGTLLCGKYKASV